MFCIFYLFVNIVFCILFSRIPSAYFVSSDAIQNGLVSVAVVTFSGSVDLARELVRRGWYISFSGVVTFKNAPRVKEVAASVPLDRRLVETDAPYLAPHPFRGTMNDSAKMWYTAETLAELHGISVDEMITVTAENAARLYGITL